MKKLLNKKGFTLIELIVVIAILAILALILVPSITNYIGQATRAKDAANARSLYTQTTLEVATNASATDGTGIAVGGAPTDYTCTYDIVSNTVENFECVTGSGTYSQEDGFDPN